MERLFFTVSNTQWVRIVKYLMAVIYIDK